jgi:hypothetical protein
VSAFRASRAGGEAPVVLCFSLDHHHIITLITLVVNADGGGGVYKGKRKNRTGQGVVKRRKYVVHPFFC